MENRKVLIVEDDKMISTLSGMLLANLEYQISGKLQTGEEAIEHCIKNTPDVILMDVHLSGKYNGVETACEIMANSDIPVIYLTSDTSIEVLNSMLEIPFFGLIIKPMTKDMLNIALKLALKQKVFLKENAIAIKDKPILFVSENIIIYANKLAISKLSLLHEYDILGKNIVSFIAESSCDDFKLQLSKLNPQETINLVFDSTFHNKPNKDFNSRVWASSVAFNNQVVTKLLILD